MACTETYATLRIFSADVHPDEIGDVLGVEATGTTPRDPDSKYKVRREWHLWSWQTRGLVESTDNTKHLAEIIKQLDGCSDSLRKLRDMGCQTDIFCYWVSNGQGGPSLEVDMMGDLHKLGLPVSWDMYFGSEDESDE